MTSIVKRAALPTALVGLVISAIAYFVKGTNALAGAALGVTIVVVFFSIGQVFLDRVIKSNPSMALSVALMIYLAKIGILFILLLLFKDTEAFDTKVFALAILTCTLVWTGAEVWAFSTSKVLYVEPGSGPDIMPEDHSKRFDH